jgi:hypothetical protein
MASLVVGKSTSEKLKVRAHITSSSSYSNDHLPQNELE